MHSPRSLREEWLDPAVVRLRPAAPLDPEALGALRERIAAGAAAGARWVVLDFTGVAVAGDDVAGGLLAEARALRARRGELVVAGAAPEAARRLAGAGLAVLRSAADVAVLLREADDARRLPIEALALPRLDPE